jgi:hypothetical protein
VATRAVYTFIGFPGLPVRHLYLPHDGYPTGAAWRFRSALQNCARPAELLDCFQSSQSGSVPLHGQEEAVDAEYRYRLEYSSAPLEGIQVQAWRRQPGSHLWILRCGPMPLALFIRRFLPSDSV